VPFITAARCRRPPTPGFLSRPDHPGPDDPRPYDPESYGLGPYGLGPYGLGPSRWVRRTRASSRRRSARSAWPARS
jgi:hypothetical protein